MPPIQLSRAERSSLQRIISQPCHPGDIPVDHQEKFINYGLVRKHVLLLYATPLGQCEFLRQRFRGMPFPQQLSDLPSEAVRLLEARQEL